MQAGHRPMVVIKDKNNSLLIIKLQSNAVRGDEISSFDSKEISNFSAEADLFTTFCVVNKLASAEKLEISLKNGFFKQV